MTVCVWVRVPWAGTPGGQGREPVLSPMALVCPQGHLKPGLCWGLCDCQAGGAGKHSLNWPFFPWEQRPGSFPAPEGGWTGLGKQQCFPHFPVTSPVLVSSSMSSSISNYKAFLMHKIIEISAKPIRSWSCRKEFLAIMEGHNQYYCHKMSVVTTLANFPNGLA